MKGTQKTRMPRRGRGARKGHREDVAVRQALAMRLRRSGMTFREIADKLSVSLVQAYRDVDAGLRETLEQRDMDARKLRAMELARLDALQIAIWPAAQRGDCESVRAAVRIIERRSRLLGLDAATSVSLGGLVQVAVDERRYERLSSEQLMRKLDETRGLLHAAIEAERAAALPADAPQPDVDDDDPVVRYERALAARRNGGETTH